MSCDESRIYLAAYFDNELDVAECLRVQQHLAECADCRRLQQEHATLQTALRDSELYAQPSADFAKRIQASVLQAAVDESRRERESWWARFGGFGWVAATVALAVLAIVVGTLVLNRGSLSPNQLLAGAVVAGHIRSLQPGHLVDVPSSDHHTVKPWFQGKLDFSPPVPELSAAGFPLVGGRLDYMDGRQVAAVVYSHRLHQINVFLWPNHGSVDESIRSDEVQGYQVLHWSSAEMNYWVVSDLNRAELVEFAQFLRSQ